MKDPLIARRRRTKIRVLVSFNGGFRRRQPSGKLRYTGGETRIMSVDRGITFSRLKSQVLDLVVQSGNIGCTFFSLKYQLQDSSETERSDHLVSITCDDDVLCMVEEFEQREFQGKHTRLWVFACTSSDNVFVDDHNDLHGNYGGLSNGFLKTGSGAKSERGKKMSDDCLRKMVLKQQLLAKQTNKIRDLKRGSESGNRNREGGFDVYRVNMLDYEYRNGDFGGDENFKKDLSLPLSKSLPLNSKDNNLRLGVNCSIKGSSGRDCFVLDKSDFGGVGLGSYCLGAELQSNRNSGIAGVNAMLEPASGDLTQLSNTNRENMVPWSNGFNMGRNGSVALLSRSNQLVASTSVCTQGNQEVLGGTRHHRVGLSGSRNTRNSPYQIRSRGNVYEMRKHHNFTVNGESSIGKISPGLRSSSSILKRGQTMRSYNFASSKDSSGHQYPTIKDMTEMNSLHPNNDSSLEQLVDQSGQGPPQHGEGNSTECHLDFCSGSIVKSVGTASGAMNSQKDLSNCPDAGNFEVQCQALSRDALDRSTNCQPLSDISKDPNLLNQQEVINIISFEDSLEDNLKWSCDSMTSSSYQKYTSLAAVDLSLHDLYLSRSSKMELEGSPCATNDISQSFLKPQSLDFDAMDDEHLNSGPQVEKSNGAAASILPDSDFRKKNCKKSEEDMQHITQTNLSICELVENRNTSKSSNVNGVIPADIFANCPYAAKTDLQAIRNTDLEYIKELGSGTYGTVFYGKWKGSDVAIKRLKPSCFTEGVLEEDRLVTDFWKEAHLLGQLHHPNIVALYGVVTDDPVNNLATVTEYMVNGSLKQVLRRKDRTIDRRKRLIIAMDAAFGMEYLHEKNIVHFDLKSHNFLVNMRDPQRPVCKIGDLGLSKIKKRTLVSGGVRGTIPWMAPELLNGENMVTEKVDVYSFGIVMWELLTGEEPYSKMRAEEVIGGIMRGSLRPEIPSWCDPGWRSLMERCWSADPKARPAFSDIAKELRAMAAAINIK